MTTKYGTILSRIWKLFKIKDHNQLYFRHNFLWHGSGKVFRDVNFETGVMQMPENKWIEIISLRFSSHNHRQTTLDIFDQIQREFETPPDMSQPAELYENTNVETDWSIYLYWNKTAEAPPSKTVLGLSIAESFRSLGLVNHSVWIQKDTVNA